MRCNRFTAFNCNKLTEEIYCIYLRKSREDREVEKYENIDTLDRHRKTLLTFAEQHNMKIGCIYEEVVSGETIAEREKMQKLLMDVEDNKWTGVLVMEVERLARGDTSDQAVILNAFKYSETKIITPLKTYNPVNESDEEFFEFGLFMSRREYKTINRRLQRGRMASVNEGKYVGSVPPFGYDRKKLENAKGYTLVVNTKEAQIVKKIFELYAYQEEYINGVVRTLNKSEMKPRKSIKWSISAVKDILNNPVYIGKIRWNARKEVISTRNGKKIISRPRSKEFIEVDGLHEAIIDRNIWDTVQVKRSKNAPSVQHENIVKNPLVGVVFCEKCGKAMQRRPYTSKSNIPSLMCPNPECDNISSKLHIVEEKIIDALKIWLKSYTVDYEQLRKMKKTSQVLTEEDILMQLEMKIQKEKEKLKKIYETYEDGIYTREEFIERSSSVKSNITRMENEINPLKQKIDENDKQLLEKEKVIPKIKNVIDIYYQLENDEEKNMLLKSILEKVTYLKTEKAIRKTSDPSNFEIHLYPKITRMD